MNTLKYLNIIKFFCTKRSGAHPYVMLNVYKALIKSRITYGAIATLKETNNQEIYQLVQVVKNAALRAILGYTKSTPITTMLAEAAEYPIKYDLERAAARFIIAKLSQNHDNQNYLEKIPHGSHLMTIFNSIKNTAMVKAASSVPNNLKMFDSIEGSHQKNVTPNIILKKSSLETISKFENYFMIYTDGSLDEDSRGIGIYFNDTKEMYSRRIMAEVSICTVELIAILMALKIGILMGKRKIVVLTDSKSAVVSLKRNNNNKYFSTQIHNLIHKNPEKDFVIQWIPSHVGVPGNESADAAAKNGLTSTEILDIPIPKGDNYKIIDRKIFERWKNEFKERTRIKGKFYGDLMNQQPSNVPWFKHKGLDTGKIKLFNRIRSNHTYAKNFLNLMNVIDDETCDACNEIENAEHIIFKCKKFTSERQRHNFSKKYKNYIEMCRDTSSSNISDIAEYLKEIKKDI
ncbi:uncharacterized protein DMENIID0001_109570 [Sergentomyia squamirostris]